MVDIYLITNLINDKKYVGKTTRGYKLRFEEHCKFPSSAIGNAINKYGRENFKLDLIAKVADEDWKYWETFYIHKYKSHFTEYGYNITWGGDCNPMDVPEIVEKQKAACNTEEAKKRYSEMAKKWNNSEKRKQVQKKFNEKYFKDPDYIYRCTRGFREYNESRRVRVGIIENEQVVVEFESLSDACEFTGRPTKEAGNILKVADKYNKNGTRKKMFGYSWTKLNKEELKCQ